MLLSYIK